MPEISKNKETDPNDGPHVEVAERAVNLLDALSGYFKRYGEFDGDVAFFAAFGGFALTKAGVGLFEVECSVKEEKDRFKKKYGDRTKRQEYREILNSQIQGQNGSEE